MWLDERIGRKIPKTRKVWEKLQKIDFFVKKIQNFSFETPVLCDKTK
jgi:hypothetical protein